MELENIPDEFSAVIVRFLWEDGTEESIPLVYGGKLKEDRIPEVPERAGFTAEWEGLDDTNLDRIVKDLSFKAVYTAKKETIQSDELRENDMPVMLVQGLFGVGQAIELNSTTDCPSLSLGEAWAESWEFSFPNGGEVTKLRYSIPPGSKEDAIRLMVRDESGQWQARSYTAEGSYLVFSVTEGDNAVCLINSPDLIMMLMVSVGAIAVVFLAFLLRSRLRRK